MRLKVKNSRRETKLQRNNSETRLPRAARLRFIMTARLRVYDKLMSSRFYLIALRGSECGRKI